MKVAPVHRYELACRLIEALYDVPRPPGINPEFLIERLEARIPGQGDKWLAAADAACIYINECIERAKGEKHETTEHEAHDWRGTAQNTSNTTH